MFTLLSYFRVSAEPATRLRRSRFVSGMHQHDVRTRLGEASFAPSSWAGATADVLALEAHASEGCSICARALVNTRELAVSLALSEAPVRPAERSRAALLSRTRGLLAARAARGAAASSAPRVIDPSATIAHRHIAHPSEPGRLREIEALRALEQRPGEGTGRLLAQLARFLDFSLFFVSIVRGDRVVYRAQRGLPESMAAFRELRREMSYCTHTVSGEAPLVVENAREEPFFRGNKAVTRFGVVAYAGVPLRTAAGVVVGTLCALDFAPRAITPAMVSILEVFARRAVAEIERERTPALLASVLEATSERGDVHGEGFFRDLVAAQHARRAEHPSALLSIRAATPERLLDWVDAHETAGRLAPGVLGLLLPGVGAGAAAPRLAQLRAAAGPSEIHLAFSSEAERPADWIACP